MDNVVKAIESVGTDSVSLAEQTEWLRMAMLIIMK
jgi:hypothetical protein